MYVNSFYISLKSPILANQKQFKTYYFELHINKTIIKQKLKSILHDDP